MKLYKKETKCIKCGHKFAFDTWKDIILPTMKIHFDTISRKCCNCGYTWNEKPLDFKGE